MWRRNQFASETLSKRTGTGRIGANGPHSKSRARYHMMTAFQENNKKNIILNLHIRYQWLMHGTAVITKIFGTLLQLFESTGLIQQ